MLRLPCLSYSIQNPWSVYPDRPNTKHISPSSSWALCYPEEGVHANTTPPPRPAQLGPTPTSLYFYKGSSLHLEGPPLFAPFFSVLPRCLHPAWPVLPSTRLPPGLFPLVTVQVICTVLIYMNCTMNDRYRYKS